MTMWKAETHFKPVNTIQITLVNWLARVLRELQDEHHHHYTPSLSVGRLYDEVDVMLTRVAENNTTKVDYVAKVEDDRILVLAKNIHADREFITIEEEVGE